MAAPQVPQRPARSQNIPIAPAHTDVPQVPARPKRTADRSASPERDSFARSPLNDPSFHANGKLQSLTQLSKRISRELPPRPPSVENFPSIGQEGHEYAALHGRPDAAEDAVPTAQTSNVAGDLPLHAPKASLPASAAKSRIAAVTRTDSNQAALAGIGSPASEENFPHSLTRSSSSQPSRPQSLYSKDAQYEIDEQGIPEIGLQIPLLPHAGDVQAPTPSPAVYGAPGPYVASNGAAPAGRHHSRTKSGREIFHGPPGSYGMHGHGVIAKDPLEKAWYQKHPDEMEREAQGEYGPAIQDNRKEWALSSEELNKLVHTPAIDAVGASHIVVGTPDEQIGYMASEEYASRMASPRPSSAQPIHGRRPSSQVYAESPLRKMSFPVNEAYEAIEAAGPDAHAIEVEDEREDDVIHIDPPPRPHSIVTAGGYETPTEDLGTRGGNAEAEGGYMSEEGYGVPILAADEVSLRPEAQYMQPAIDPEANIFAGADSEAALYPGSRRGSKSVSRPGSTGPPATNLARFAGYDERADSGTPLEDVKEYEPLFPDDDGEKKNMNKSTVERIKRLELARHHFPSKDVWEDAPNSLLYETTVKTPQLPDDSFPAAEHEPKEIFETPEAEEARKKEITREGQGYFLPAATKNLAKTNFKPEVTAEMAAAEDGVVSVQRFPSKDIWEDTPEHHMHTTIISPEPQNDETTPTEAKVVPQIPARPARSKAGQAPPAAEADGTPSVDKRAPVVPERPKPHVPARPSKPITKPAESESPLTKVTSAEKAAPPPVKAKPVIPARPVGGKIAALQAGFMKDLNQRLQIGPQAPKKEESLKEAEAEQEKAPLADARKGRAKGPSRRKPGVSPTPSAPAVAPAPENVSFGFSKVITVWETDEERLVVPGETASSESVDAAAPTISKPTTTTATLEPIAPASEELPEIQPTAKPAEEAVETVSHGGPAETTPSPKENIASRESIDDAVQTGQKEISIDKGEGEPEKIVAYVGGRADKPGSVLVDAKGEEHVTEADAPGNVEKAPDVV